MGLLGQCAGHQNLLPLSVAKFVCGTCGQVFRAGCFDRFANDAVVVVGQATVPACIRISSKRDEFVRAEQAHLDAVRQDNAQEACQFRRRDRMNIDSIQQDLAYDKWAASPAPVALNTQSGLARRSRPGQRQHQRRLRNMPAHPPPFLAESLGQNSRFMPLPQ